MLPPNRFHPPRRPPFIPPNTQQQNNLSKYYKTPDGRWDIDKISGSIGRMNKLVGQISPIVKQLKGFLKK